MFLSFVAAVMSFAHPSCQPLPRADEILSKPDLRWIIVGESHGTNEIPEAFSNLVCIAAEAKGPVVVALEFPQREQGRIDAFMRSDGGADAVTRLLSGEPWTAKQQDGRGSRAMLRLFEDLRLMSRAGKVERVMAFRSQQGSDAAIADAWRSAYRGKLVLVLVGDAHAMRLPVAPGPGGGVSAASLLPQEYVVTLKASGNGGSLWSCTGSSIGLTTVQCGTTMDRPPRRSFPRGLVFVGDADQPWSGWLNLGTPTTASLPAAQ